MKQTILHFSMLVFLSLPLAAQVTIDREDYPRQASFTDSFRVITAANIPFPATGADQSWDYSTLAAGNTGTVLYSDATNDPDFPDALNFHEENLQFSLGGLGYTVGSNIYEAIDDTGWYFTGRSFDTMSVSLTILTGQPDDRIEYIPNKFDYVGRLDFIQFPLNYQDQWSGGYYYDYDYKVTAVPFSLNQTPATNRRRLTEDREVAGYGSLIIPSSDGSPSQEMEVLLVKSTRVQIDSIFLGGSPAPQNLLSAFGLEQGRVVRDSAYRFYMPGFAAPVVIFESDTTMGMASTVTYRPQAADVSTATREINVAVLKSFPNPLSAGSLLSVAIPMDSASGTVRFFDGQGRWLQTVAYRSADGQSLQVQVPAAAKAGMLLYQVRDAQAQVIGVGKVLVK